MFTLEDALQWKFAAAVGYFYMFKLLIYFSYESWSGFRTFVWSRIRSNVDLKSTYGQWAVVTGCTDGIGKEFAKQMAGRGMNVVLISRNEHKLKTTQAELQAVYDVDVKYIQADFTSTAIYDKIRKELEDLDIGILVNNVGIANEANESIADQKEEYFKDVVNVNILGTVICSTIVLKQMMVRKRGLIINMGSISGVLPVPYMSVYSGTKAFVRFFSNCISKELAEYNIDVKCFNPSFIDTMLFADMPDIHKFLKNFMSFYFPSPGAFVRSAVAAVNTDVIDTAGYWTHAFAIFLGEAFLGRANMERVARLTMTSRLIWRKKK